MTHVIRQQGVIRGTRVGYFLALVHAVNDILTAILGALLPTVQARLTASTTVLALLVAAFSISSSVTQPLLGALADRAGARLVAGGGLALSAVALSFVGTAGTFAMLIVLLVLGGIGSAALHPVSTSIVGGPSVKKPGLAVGLFTAGGMVGFAAGPVVILHLVQRYGADITPWFMLPGLALAVGVVTLLPKWEPHRSTHRASAGRGALFSPDIAALTVASTLVSLVFITFTSAVPLWLVTNHDFRPDSQLLGFTLGTFSLAAGIGAVAGGAAAGRWGYARTAAVTLAAAVVPLAAVLVLPPGPNTLIAAAGAGLLLYASQPLLIVAAQASAPEAPAAAAGVVLGVGNALAGALYVGVGALQGFAGMVPAVGLTFALVIPAAMLTARALPVGRESTRDRAEETPIE